MKVRVCIQKMTFHDIYIDVTGVNSLDSAEKCAMRLIEGKYQPNAKKVRTIPPYTNMNARNFEVLED